MCKISIHSQLKADFRIQLVTLRHTIPNNLQTNNNYSTNKHYRKKMEEIEMQPVFHQKKNYVLSLRRL